ncbi:hypothetical protein WN48_10696 [Eufriesea mexicana]|uniref:Uncharacterized protein n=1 Tax=Eufriesea mexicana TaxID=516756 RepID=A0A310SCY7_9HYME|nr:PREDICTED: uncharacterized protein LOC108552932 [Eufriesea mexicana]OAD53183.1 hypothetical protein WN48_10696 [Eufriesea mexicana]
MTEDVSVMIQRGLSEWWSEETEYIFQRIERWAAYARGYNRLRSQRLSRGRLTMQGGQERRWNISSNKLVIDDSSWSPRFHTLKKSRRKSRPEETKINCCGTFNYQSSSNLDSSCLETYRYDHSIYFKTIGDIRNGKKEISGSKDAQEDRVSISSEELVEWDVESVSDFIANQLLEDRYTGNNDENVFDSSESPSQTENLDSVTWHNVDLSKLELNGNEVSVATINEECDDNNLTVCENPEERNNNYVGSEESVTDANLENQIRSNRVVEGENNAEKTQEEEEENEEQGIKRFLEIRRTKRAYRTVKQLPIVGDNEVLWPSVLLNYTKNIDPSNSPHHYNKLRK